jgi:7,8-dihydro-6-hydroxymethylpterin dimethyltransferase
VAGMHFMDLYNYDVERVKRCVIHYAAPNGLIYPFCA